MNITKPFAYSVSALIVTAGLAYAATNQVSIQKQGGQICIRSNAIPNHTTGKFPNKRNPNSIRQIRINTCVTANPKKGPTPIASNRGAIGIALNGVMIRPESAGYWDPSHKRGFSQNPASGWRLEPMGPKNTFGLDKQNAHVDKRGLYHYHGISSGLLKASNGSQVAYAADGFEIHYMGSKVKSGYVLKPGSRPSGGNNPGGKYDGTFTQDYEYVGGNGTLDQCNGGILNGKFVYFVTDTFPYYPRCLYGPKGKGFR